MQPPTAEELVQLLKERDRLIQQLAQELVHTNQHNRSLQAQLDQRPQAQVPPASESIPATEEQTIWLERQLARAREELSAKEKENRVLLENLQQAQQDNQKLQQYLRELPDLYRRKFAERLVPFKERMSQIQSENDRLQQFIQGLERQLPESQLPPLLPPPKQMHNTDGHG
ncbi:hypothetical protein [Anthocerotibacter panamensis]|uniref:hypothetical protein n=1 Tax=Anthocerotibacter panamensis TaxID=2857077 RepID=UPI001C4066F7|nr:hypothetical protein [Anthocerotibacter panamensis]